jgi:hypothetical protein
MRFVAIDGKTLQGLLSTGFGDVAGALLAGDGSFKLTTEISGKARHNY